MYILGWGLRNHLGLVSFSTSWVLFALTEVADSARSADGAADHW